MKVPGKKYAVDSVGTVYVWLYTPQAFLKIQMKLQEMNLRGHGHTIEVGDLSELFKSGVPVMQPNPVRKKKATLYKITWRPKTITVRNFQVSDYDSRFYNWLRFVGYPVTRTDVTSSMGADSLPLMARSEWPPMIDNATHPTVDPDSLKAAKLVDDPDYDPLEHDSSRD